MLTWNGRHWPLPCRNDKHHERRRSADGDRHDGSFRSELAAGKDIGAGERGVPQALEGVAGDGAAEDTALAEVPAEMQTDGQPQIAHQHIGRREQHAGLQRDGKRRW